jgi:RING finger protein 121/175
MNFLLSHDEHSTQKSVPQYILLVILFFVISLQLLVQFWKKYHPKSYNYTTLTLMWILPFAASVYFQFWRMIILWIIYTYLSTQMLLKTMQKPLNPKTPRFKDLNFLTLELFIVFSFGFIECPSS